MDIAKELKGDMFLIANAIKKIQVSHAKGLRRGDGVGVESPTAVSLVDLVWI